MITPTPITDASLPTAVTVYEVGARDGLQNESATVPTATKAEFIRRLAAAGSSVVEATSVVHPKWVPQLADAEALLDDLASTSALAGVSLPVLVPNMRGYERAKAHGVKTVAVFVSATETFSQRNLNRSIAESMAATGDVVQSARADGIGVRGYVSMCFGDPWEGATPLEQVVAVGRELLDMGCYELSLGDTIGVATPGHVKRLLYKFDDAGTAVSQLAVHFHDTYGQALSNTLSALECGVTTVDASAGGLGGCPFAKNATGNLATEDLVWMLHGLGIDTGIDLSQLITTSLWMADQLGKPSVSRVVAALGAEINTARSAS
jgi:hydroxymethylglutaryl-CoA lyase